MRTFFQFVIGVLVLAAISAVGALVWAGTASVEHFASFITELQQLRLIPAALACLIVCTFAGSLFWSTLETFSPSSRVRARGTAVLTGAIALCWVVWWLTVQGKNFDPHTGQSLRNLAISPSGEYEVFGANVKYHPVTGVELLALTPELIAAFGITSDRGTIQVQKVDPGSARWFDHLGKPLLAYWRDESQPGSWEFFRGFEGMLHPERSVPMKMASLDILEQWKAEMQGIQAAEAEQKRLEAERKTREAAEAESARLREAESKLVDITQELEKARRAKDVEEELRRQAEASAEQLRRSERYRNHAPRAAIPPTAHKDEQDTSEQARQAKSWRDELAETHKRREEQRWLEEKEAVLQKVPAFDPVHERRIREAALEPSKLETLNLLGFAKRCLYQADQHEFESSFLGRRFRHEGTVLEVTKGGAIMSGCIIGLGWEVLLEIEWFKGQNPKIKKGDRIEIAGTFESPIRTRQESRAKNPRKITTVRLARSELVTRQFATVPKKKKKSLLPRFKASDFFEPASDPLHPGTLFTRGVELAFSPFVVVRKTADHYSE